MGALSDRSGQWLTADQRTILIILLSLPVSVTSVAGHLHQPTAIVAALSLATTMHGPPVHGLFPLPAALRPRFSCPPDPLRGQTIGQTDRRLTGTGLALSGGGGQSVCHFVRSHSLGEEQVFIAAGYSRESVSQYCIESGRVRILGYKYVIVHQTLSQLGW